MLTVEYTFKITITNIFCKVFKVAKKSLFLSDMHGMRICPLDISPTAREIINFPNSPGGGGGIAPGSPPPFHLLNPSFSSQQTYKATVISLQILKSYDGNGDVAKSFFG